MDEDKPAGKKSFALSQKKLWNPDTFLILSPLFSFLPAAILYALNWGRLGYIKKIRRHQLVPAGK